MGAYNIVPLSGLVGAFDGWGRKLEWLWKLVQFIRPNLAKEERRGGVSQRSCTAGQILEKLRDSTHTGYPDIERISLHLTKIAEGAWLKQISAWVLYGRLPSLGAADFFISRETNQEKTDGSTDIFCIKTPLVPTFVTQSTANSILFIGKSLNHIRDRRSQMVDGFSTGTSPELELLPSHLAHLSSLGSPISSSTFSAKISAIRLSLSRNALQKLLPQSKVLELLRVLKDFFLLERGEFAVALISAADARLASRQHRSGDRSQLKGLEGLNNTIIKEGEVSAVLARTWATLSSLQSADDDDNDEDLDLARDLLRLSIKPQDTNASTKARATINLKLSDPSFNDFLLPTPVILSLRVPSPLDLVFSLSDVEIYSQIHAYLLAIRRGHLRLSQLSLLTVLRRDHPSPKAPNHLNHHDRMEALARIRQCADRRSKTMRRIWAAIGSATFFLAELGEYLQGQVIKGSWEQFHTWLEPSQATLAHDPPQFSSPNPASLQAGFLAPSQLPYSHDPETLSLAHTHYLSALTHHLLLTHAPFTAALHTFLFSTAHLCALTQRLATVQHALDFGAQDAFSNHAAEERELWMELSVAGRNVENHVKALVEVLREVDRGRAGVGMTGSEVGNVGKQEISEGEEAGFVPWGAWGVERLLLKLDWARGEEEVW